MRASHLFVGFVTAGLVAACGGSNNHHVIIDANVIDTPPDAFVCGFPTTLTSNGMTDDISAPPPPAPPPNGVGVITGQTISGVLDGSIVLVLSDGSKQISSGILMHFDDAKGIFTAPPAAGTTAGLFTTPPVAGTYPVDPENMCGACLTGFVGFDASGATIDLSTSTQAMILDTSKTIGTFNMTGFAPKAAANATTTIAGTFAAINWLGGTLNSDSSINTDDGCVSTLDKLPFIDMQVKWPATLPAGAKPTQDDPRKIDFTNLHNVPAVRLHGVDF